MSGLISWFLLCTLKCDPYINSQLLQDQLKAHGCLETKFASLSQEFSTLFQSEKVEVEVYRSGVKASSNVRLRFEVLRV